MLFVATKFPGEREKILDTQWEKTYTSTNSCEQRRSDPAGGAPFFVFASREIRGMYAERKGIACYGA